MRRLGGQVHLGRPHLTAAAQEGVVVAPGAVGADRDPVPGVLLDADAGTGGGGRRLQQPPGERQRVVLGSLDIESRLDVGPSHETLVEIYEQLRGLGSEELTNLVEETVQLVQNGDRRGLGPVSCDAACINNTRVVTD